MRRGTHEARESSPTDDRQREHDVSQAGSQHGTHRNRQQNSGEGEEDVDQPHHELVHPSAR
jgi:hypothetical protein